MVRSLEILHMTIAVYVPLDINRQMVYANFVVITCTVTKMVNVPLVMQEKYLILSKVIVKNVQMVLFQKEEMHLVGYVNLEIKNYMQM